MADAGTTLSIKSLQGRWTDDALILRVTNALQAGGKLPLSISPFGFHDGRLDLRGYRMGAPARLVGTPLEGIDFTGAVFARPWFERCQFSDVIFDLATLDGLSDQGNRYINCRFDGTSLCDSGLGYNGSQYRSCALIRCGFQRAVVIRPEFDGCRFAGCKLKGLDFNAASFEDCAFEGGITDVWFRGGFAPYTNEERKFGNPRKNRMLRVSFANAEFRHLTISDDCDLSTVVMPELGMYRRYDRFRERIRRLLAQAETWLEPFRGGGIRFAKTFVELAERQDWMMFNWTDFVDYAGVGAAERVLRSLDQDPAC